MLTKVKLIKVCYLDPPSFARVFIAPLATLVPPYTLSCHSEATLFEGTPPKAVGSVIVLVLSMGLGTCTYLKIAYG